MVYEYDKVIKKVCSILIETRKDKPINPMYFFPPSKNIFILLLTFKKLFKLFSASVYCVYLVSFKILNLSIISYFFRSSVWFIGIVFEVKFISFLTASFKNQDKYHHTKFIKDILNKFFSIFSRRKARQILVCKYNFMIHCYYNLFLKCFWILLVN